MFEEGSHVALVCRRFNGPARNDLWSTYPTLSRLWVGVTSPSLAASIALERSPWMNQLHHPSVQKTCSGQLWPCGMHAVAESSLCVGVFGIHRPGFCGGRCTGQAEKNIVRGCDHRRGSKEAGTFIKGVFRSYLWESGIRGQDVENCLKAEQRSEVAVLAISALQNCMRVYESLKIDEVRAMRQHFPMNLHGKQIGHVLGYIAGSLYGQVVLQGMSRAYQGVLEEANRRIGLSPPTPPVFNTP